MICDAMIDKPMRMATRLGTFGEILYALSPSTVDIILNQAYSLFPDSTAAKKTGGATASWRTARPATRCRPRPSRWPTYSRASTSSSSVDRRQLVEPPLDLAEPPVDPPQLGAQRLHVVLAGGQAVLDRREHALATARDVVLSALDDVVDGVGDAAGGVLGALARVDGGADGAVDGLAQGLLDVAALGHTVEDSRAARPAGGRAA